MKKVHYAIVIATCILTAIPLAARQVGFSLPPQFDKELLVLYEAMEEKIAPSEPWLRPFGEDSTEDLHQRLLRLQRDLRAEYELHVLEKYADWTKEKIEQRYREVSRPRGDATREEEKKRRREEAEIEILERAKSWMKSRANFDSNGFDNFIEPITDDYEMVRGLVGKELTDEDRKALNTIVERLNQKAATNLLIRTYWASPTQRWGKMEQHLREQAVSELKDNVRYTHVTNELARVRAERDALSQQHDKERDAKFPNVNLESTLEERSKRDEFRNSLFMQDEFQKIVQAYIALDKERADMENAIMERLKEELKAKAKESQ